MIFINRVLRYCRRKVFNFIYKIIRVFLKNKYPVNENNKINIHLGCGEIYSHEFINVDSRFFPHIHHVSQVQNLPFFPNNFADLIYTSHTLEHIPVSELNEVLLEWRRVLKPGGLLRISVPDLEKILDIYFANNKSIDAIWKPLMGGQEYKENSHYSVFNEEFLKNKLLECGFVNPRAWEPLEVSNHNFTDWSSALLKINEKLFPISLNIEANKNS